MAAVIEVADNEYERVEKDIATVTDMPEFQVPRVLEHSVLSMSSTTRCGESTASALPISSRLMRASPAKFSSSASISVSNVCKREVRAAPRWPALFHKQADPARAVTHGDEDREKDKQSP
ncbi:MAG: hypothetical protein ABSH47_27215, partial [Bryobacteraceae bacterium]